MHVGPGEFTVENGMLRTHGGMGLLWYEPQKFGNTTIRVVFKTTGPRDNSGVYIRMPEKPPDPWYGVHNGYEVQIDAAGDEWHSTGALYSLSKVSKRAQKPAGEWNTMDIVLQRPGHDRVSERREDQRFRGEISRCLSASSGTSRCAVLVPMPAISACRITTAARRCTSRRSR